MLCHVATFILLGLGSIYENGILTFLALVSLAVGLFFGKEALENPDIEEFLRVWKETNDDDDGDPPLGIG
jgi:hypothetical protein